MRYYIQIIKRQHSPNTNEQAENPPGFLLDGLSED